MYVKWGRKTFGTACCVSCIDICWCCTAMIQVWKVRSVQLEKFWLSHFICTVQDFFQVFQLEFCLISYAQSRIFSRYFNWNSLSNSYVQSMIFSLISTVIEHVSLGLSVHRLMYFWIYQCSENFPCLYVIILCALYSCFFPIHWRHWRCHWCGSGKGQILCS